MKTIINGTEFGSITINDTIYDHDILICSDGLIKKRKKKLSKAVFGTSHTISRDEARYVHEKGTRLLIIGSGQYGRVTLSEDAKKFFEHKKCHVMLLPTPAAIDEWNKSVEKKKTGLFHITC
jgi:hypothetical protein